MNPTSLIIVEQVIRSYQSAFGKDLFNYPVGAISELKLAELLFSMEYPLLAHDNSIDPCITYANATALKLWGKCWAEMIGMPSKLTAPREEWAQRDTALKKATKIKAIQNYEGVRINSQGSRFLIKGAEIWSLLDRNDKYCGQAATFNEWRNL